MISVLVPVYNTDVRKLATTLFAQAVHLPQPVEIIMLDDGSDNETLRINEEITSNSLVKYHQNGRNAGRINARSKLASLAAHNWLIFLDDDSRIEDGRFLEKYLGSLADERTILAGGRTYDIARPLLCKYVLHWKYGTERESKWRSAPGNSKGFQTNNFLIHKSVFNKIAFPAGMKGYGHEDTWMGMQIDDLGCRIKHINNPVIHLGLQTAEQFIQKSEMALQNLLFLSKQYEKRKLSMHVKIYRHYAQLKKTGMLPVVNILYRMLQTRIHKNLRSCNPDLYLFDLYRLNHFMKIAR